MAVIQESILVTIVLAPLIAALAAGLAGKFIGRAGAHTVTILGVAVSCALSIYVLKQLLDGAPVYNDACADPTGAGSSISQDRGA